MTSVTGDLRIAPATPDTAPAAAAVLAEAFAQDPTIAVLLPYDTPDRHRRLQRMFRAEMHTCGLAQVDTVLDPISGVVLGAAVWHSPYAETSGPEAMRWSLVASGALGWHGLRTGARYDRAVRPWRPRGPHWRLLDLGTSPSARGLGVGRALLAHRLQHVDTQRQPGFLEATGDDSRRLYEQYGFAAVGQLPAALGGAYAMLRPAA